jgi:hypothetical protein
MRKTDLSPAQLRDLGIFHLILEHHGWDDPWDTESRLDAGERVNPEGVRGLRNGNGYLQARFHAPVNMISLMATDTHREGKVQFHFFFDKKPERILEWIGEIGQTISLDNYPDLLKKAGGRCEMILLEVSDTEIYEVTPPAGAANEKHT